MPKFGRSKMIAFEEVDFDEALWEVRRSNPNYWKADGVRTTDAVYAPSYPEIESAYEKAGVTVYRIDETEPVENDIPDTLTDSENKSVENYAPIDSENEDKSPVDKDYESMSAADVKSIASQYTDEVVTTKAQGLVVIKQAQDEGKL
jgi:hypothetical protein